MDDSQPRKFQKDLNAGLVALVLLAVLERTKEDLSGYEIAKRLLKARRSSRRAPCTPCCVRSSAGDCSPAASCPPTPGRRGATTASPTTAAPCCASGVTSGGRRAALSIASSKEPTHERSPLDR